MVAPLFICSKPSFVSRIKSEAGAKALVTSSMIQALRWITNADLEISGIYLDPTDGSFSSLRFLEMALLQRPSTPVFLIDHASEMHTENHAHLFTLGRVQGVFKGSESWAEFLAPLRSEVHPGLVESKKRTATKSPYAGYLAIPLADFVHLKTYLCDVFIEDQQNEVHLFATQGSEVDQEYLAHVSQKTPRLFISDTNLQGTREELRAVQVSYMHLDYFPQAWRVAETLANARHLLNEMRKGGLSDALVEQTHFLLSDVFQLVSQLDQSASLSQFIEQARSCDRTMACATLSIIMCKALKFEKGAIVEILGLASLFQDVSLYRSPFGNLTEVKLSALSDQAAAYYFHHPLMSADLVAQSTSIPDVTLQVMRQHHERKDRTGFPNRIGGMQLHPMAEVLSIINAYLDRMEDAELARTDLEAEVCSHYSDRVVSAFRTMLQTLEHQKTVALENVA